LGVTNSSQVTEKWLSGMRAFTVVWFGQFISLLGTNMTNFAITIWAWQQTGEATTLALTGLAFVLPNVLMYPIAGALVDRWNRKFVMMISDLAAGISTIFILIFFIAGRLEIWHILTANVFSGLFQSFQFPAYSAAVSTMLPKEQYTRASGMLSLAQNTSGILSPVAAGILLTIIGTGGILLFDILSFIVAIIALLAVTIPQPKINIEKNQNSLLEDTTFGFKYILARPGLLGLQLVFFTINFTGSLCFPLLAPMILARTGDNTLILGTVQSAFGVGGVIGGLVLSIWGGPIKRVHGVLMGMAISSIFGMTLIGLGKSVYLWASGAFIMMFVNPTINGSNQAIWQSKVPPEIQGRVFSTRALIALFSQPIAIAISGPLADRFLNPGMMDGGSLTSLFSWLVGIGPGAGISLLFFVMGIVGFFTGLGGYLFKQVRNVEEIIPDHEGFTAVLSS
jgi:MFS family permease